MTQYVPLGHVHWSWKTCDLWPYDRSFPITDNRDAVNRPYIRIELWRELLRRTNGNEAKARELLHQYVEAGLHGEELVDVIMQRRIKEFTDTAHTLTAIA